MIRSLTQQVVRVAMVATLTVAVAEAQSGGGSDFTGPGGGGGGAGGSYAPLGVPRGIGINSPTGTLGLLGARNSFASAGLGGLSIPDPAGGSVTLDQATAQAVAAVLRGAGAEAAQNLQNILVSGGLPATAASALVNAIAGITNGIPVGTRGDVLITASAVRSAVQAFNAAVDASSGKPSPAMLAIRFALASASR